MSRYDPLFKKMIIFFIAIKALFKRLSIPNQIWILAIKCNLKL
jgi:hypothetical protein